MLLIVFPHSSAKGYSINHLPEKVKVSPLISIEFIEKKGRTNRLLTSGLCGAAEKRLNAYLYYLPCFICFKIENLTEALTG